MSGQQLAWLEGNAANLRDDRVGGARNSATIALGAAIVGTVIGAGLFFVGDDVLEGFGYSEEQANAWSYVFAVAAGLFVYVALRDMQNSNARAEKIASAPLEY